MATAVVRFAARRLAGQQPPAILGSKALPGLNRGGSPSYVRRFTSTEAAAPKIETQIKLLDNKKEELYDLIAKVNHNVPSFLRRQHNKRLLAFLSVQIEPRPNDRNWRSHRRSCYFSICVSITTACLAVCYLGSELKKKTDE